MSSIRQSGEAIVPLPRDVTDKSIEITEVDDVLTYNVYDGVENIKLNSQLKQLWPPKVVDTHYGGSLYTIFEYVDMFHNPQSFKTNMNHANQVSRQCRSNPRSRRRHRVYLDCQNSQELAA